MGKILSQRSHTRIKFTPLSIQCKLTVLSNESPVTQNYDALTNTFDPNRALSPTLILPVVTAIDKDGLLVSTVVNRLLSVDTGDLLWKVNGKPIGEVWGLPSSSNYEINTQASDTRGSLKLYRNIPADESYTLTFVGKFVDWRTGAVIEVQSDNLLLSTTMAFPDELGLTISTDRFEYDPLQDHKLLYDYLKARITAKEDDYTAALAELTPLLSMEPGKFYDTELKAFALVGTSTVETAEDLTELGLSVRVVRKGQSTALVPKSADAPELISIEYPVIKFDARQIDENAYVIQLLQGSAVVAQQDFAIIRKLTMPSANWTKPFFGTDISAGMEFYRNKAFVARDNSMQIPYPELYYLITWYTQRWSQSGATPVYKDAVRWQLGKYLFAEVSRIGIGNNIKESVFDVYFTVEAHAKAERITDENGNYLTDENGNYLIC